MADLLTSPAPGALRKTLARSVVTRSLLVSLVVGTILNIINQGPELARGLPPNLVKLILTYAVPFCVASYGAYTAFREQERHDA